MTRRPRQAQAGRRALPRFALQLERAAAVLPLGIAGWWLARQTVRSAQALLLSQLNGSLSSVQADIARRWEFRKGDLLMLAGNEVMARTIAGGVATPEDSIFLFQMYAEFARAMPAVLVRTHDGSVRWSFGEARALDGAQRFSMILNRRDTRMSITIPVLRDASVVGHLEAEVRLSGVLPMDSMPVLLGGLRLSVADSLGRPFEYPGLSEWPAEGARYEVEGQEWLVARRALADPPLILAVAASSMSFVAPYERAATIGLVVFAAVGLISIGLSGYLTRRITKPLEQLVQAADSVCRGDLNTSVAVSGPGEIGTLSKSFADMLDSLRTILQELSERRALATIGELSATLAHEVRNGLSAVRVDLQRLEESRRHGVEADLARRALHNVERLNSTVTSTLAVARGGRVPARPVALNEVLATAAIGAGPSFSAARAQLTMHPMRTASPRIAGDAAALEHLFLNILINAAQAMPNGGEATVDVECVDRSARISITDTGQGMNREQIATLSRPFTSVPEVRDSASRSPARSPRRTVVRSSLTVHQVPVPRYAYCFRSSQRLKPNVASGH